MLLLSGYFDPFHLVHFLPNFPSNVLILVFLPGADDIYPQIRKKQRGLLIKLQQEQAEIKRLREANALATKERQLLLYQQQEINR